MRLFSKKVNKITGFLRDKGSYTNALPSQNAKSLSFLHLKISRTQSIMLFALAAVLLLILFISMSVEAFNAKAQDGDTPPNLERPLVCAQTPEDLQRAGEFSASGAATSSVDIGASEVSSADAGDTEYAAGGYGASEASSEYVGFAACAQNGASEASTDSANSASSDPVSDTLDNTGASEASLDTLTAQTYSASEASTEYAPLGAPATAAGLTCTVGAAAPDYNATNPGTVSSNDTYIINGMRFIAVGYNDGTNRCGAGISKTEMDSYGEGPVVTLLQKYDGTTDTNYMYTNWGTDLYGNGTSDYANSRLHQSYEAFTRMNMLHHFPGIVRRDLASTMPERYSSSAPYSYAYTCSITTLEFGSGGYCPNGIAGPAVSGQYTWPLSAYEAVRVGSTLSKWDKYTYLRTPYIWSGTQNCYLGLAGTAGGLTQQYCYSQSADYTMRPALLYKMSDLANIREKPNGYITNMRIQNNRAHIDPEDTSDDGRSIVSNISFNVASQYASGGVIMIPLSGIYPQGRPGFNHLGPLLFKCSDININTTSLGSIARSVVTRCGVGEFEDYIGITLKDQGEGGVNINGQYSFKLTFKFNNDDYANKIPIMIQLFNIGATAYVDTVLRDMIGTPSFNPSDAYGLSSTAGFMKSINAYYPDNWPVRQTEYNTAMFNPTHTVTNPTNYIKWDGNPINYSVFHMRWYKSASRYNLQTTANSGAGAIRTCFSAYMPPGANITRYSPNTMFNTGDSVHVTRTNGYTFPGSSKVFDRYTYCLTDDEATNANSTQALGTQRAVGDTTTGFTFDVPGVAAGQTIEIRLCDESAYVNQTQNRTCWWREYTRDDPVVTPPTDPVLMPEWRLTWGGSVGSYANSYSRFDNDVQKLITNANNIMNSNTTAFANHTRNTGRRDIEGYSVFTTQWYSPDGFEFRNTAHAAGIQRNYHARVAIGDYAYINIVKGSDAVNDPTYGVLPTFYNKVKLRVFIADVRNDVMLPSVDILVDNYTPAVLTGRGFTDLYGCTTQIYCAFRIPLTPAQGINLGDGEIIQGLQLIAMGENGTPAEEGILTRMQGIGLGHGILNSFPGQSDRFVWPDGTPFHVADYSTGNGCYWTGTGTSERDGRYRENKCNAKTDVGITYLDYPNANTPQVNRYTGSYGSATINYVEGTEYNYANPAINAMGQAWTANGQLIDRGKRVTTQLSYTRATQYDSLEQVNPEFALKIPHGARLVGDFPTGTRDGYAPPDGTTWTSPGGANTAQIYWQNTVTYFPTNYATSGDASHFPVKVTLVSHDKLYDYYTFTITNANHYGADTSWRDSGLKYNDHYITARDINNNVNQGNMLNVTWELTEYTNAGRYPGEIAAERSYIAISTEDKSTYSDIGTFDGTPRNNKMTQETAQKFGLWQGSTANYAMSSAAQNVFLVSAAPHLQTQSSFSISSVDSGNWHTGGTSVYAAEGDEVKIKITFTNDGDVPYSNLRFYMRNPMQGDALGSNGNVEFHGITDANDQPLDGEIKFAKNPALVNAPLYGASSNGHYLDLSSASWWSNAVWSATEPDVVTHIKGDIAGVLAPGDTFDVVLKFKLPDNQAAKIIMQMAYSVKAATFEELKFNDNTAVYAISTEYWSIRYNPIKPSDYPNAAFPGQNVTNTPQFTLDDEYVLIYDTAAASNCVPNSANCYRLRGDIPRLKGYQFNGWKIYSQAGAWGNAPTRTLEYDRVFPGAQITFNTADEPLGKIELEATWVRAKSSLLFMQGTPNGEGGSLSPISPDVVRSNQVPEANRGAIKVGVTGDDKPVPPISNADYFDNTEFANNGIYWAMQYWQKPVNVYRDGSTIDYSVNTCETGEPYSASNPQISNQVCRRGYDLQGFYTSAAFAAAQNPLGKVLYDPATGLIDASAPRVDFEPNAINDHYCSNFGEAGVAESIKVPWCTISSQNDERIRLYAAWNAHQVTMYFDGNGGTGSVTSKTWNFANTWNKYDLPGETMDGFSGIGTPARANYIFRGWSTSPSTCTGAYYTNTQGTIDFDPELTLYACWVEQPKIHFEGNGNTGGAAPADIYCPRDTPCTLPRPTRAEMGKDWYNFSSWNTAANGSGSSYNGAQSYTNLAAEGATLTLYARWQGNLITLVYHPNNYGIYGITYTHSLFYNQGGFTLKNRSIEFGQPLPEGRTYLNGGTWGTGRGSAETNWEGTSGSAGGDVALFGNTFEYGQTVAAGVPSYDAFLAQFNAQTDATYPSGVLEALRTDTVTINLYALWKRLPANKIVASAVAEKPNTIAAEYTKHSTADDAHELKGIDIRCSNSAALASADPDDHQAPTSQLISGFTGGGGTFAGTGGDGTYFELAGVQTGDADEAAALAHTFPSWFAQFNWEKASVNAPGDWRCQYRVIDRYTASTTFPISDSDYQPWNAPSDPIHFNTIKSSVAPAAVPGANHISSYFVGDGFPAAKKEISGAAQVAYISPSVEYTAGVSCENNFHSPMGSFSPGYGGVTTISSAPTQSSNSWTARVNVAQDPILVNAYCSDITAPEATFKHSIPSINTPTVRIAVDTFSDNFDGTDPTKIEWQIRAQTGEGGDGAVVMDWTTLQAKNYYDDSFNSSVSSPSENDRPRNIHVRDSSGNARVYSYVPYVRFAKYQIAEQDLPSQPFGINDVGQLDRANWPEVRYYALSTGGNNPVPNNLEPEIVSNNKADPVWKKYRSSVVTHDIDNQYGQDWVNAPTECNEDGGTDWLHVNTQNVTYNCIYTYKPDTDTMKELQVQVHTNHNADIVSTYTGKVHSNDTSWEGPLMPSSIKVWADDLEVPRYDFDGHHLKSWNDVVGSHPSEDLWLFPQAGEDYAGAGTQFKAEALRGKALEAALASAGPVGNDVYPDTFTYTAYRGWELNSLNISYTGGAGSTGTPPSTHTCLYSDAQCLIKDRKTSAPTMAKAGHYLSTWKVVAPTGKSWTGRQFAKEADIKRLMGSVGGDPNFDVNYSGPITLEAVWAPMTMSLRVSPNISRVDYPELVDQGKDQYQYMLTYAQRWHLISAHLALDIPAPTGYYYSATNGARVARPGEINHDKPFPYIDDYPYVNCDISALAATAPDRLDPVVTGLPDAYSGWYNANDPERIFGSGGDSHLAGCQTIGAARTLNQTIIDMAANPNTAGIDPFEDGYVGDFEPMLVDDIIPYKLTHSYDKVFADATGTVATKQCTYGYACTLRTDKFTRPGYTQTGWKDSVTGAIYGLGGTYGNRDNNGLTDVANATRTFEAVWTPNAPAGQFTVTKGNQITRNDHEAAVNAKFSWSKPSNIDDADIHGYQFRCDILDLVTSGNIGTTPLPTGVFFEFSAPASATEAYSPIIDQFLPYGMTNYYSGMDCKYRIKTSATASEYSAFSASQTVWAKPLDLTISGTSSVTMDGVNLFPGDTLVWIVGTSASWTAGGELWEPQTTINDAYNITVQCGANKGIKHWWQGSGQAVAVFPFSFTQPPTTDAYQGNYVGKGINTAYIAYTGEQSDRYGSLFGTCDDITPPTLSIYEWSQDSSSPEIHLDYTAADAVSNASQIKVKIGLSEGGDDICPERTFAERQSCLWTPPNTMTHYKVYYTVTDAAGNISKYKKAYRAWKRSFVGNQDGAGNSRPLPPAQYGTIVMNNPDNEGTAPTDINGIILTCRNGSCNSLLEFRILNFPELPLDTPWAAALKYYCKDGTTCASGNQVATTVSSKSFNTDETLTAKWVRNDLQLIDAHLYGPDGTTPAKVADTTQVFKTHLKWKNYGTGANQMQRTGTPSGDLNVKLKSEVGGKPSPISEIDCDTWTPLNSNGETTCTKTLTGTEVIKGAGQWLASTKYIAATANTEAIAGADVFRPLGIVSPFADVAVDALPVKLTIEDAGVTGKTTLDPAKFRGVLRLDDGTPSGALFPADMKPKGTITYSVLFEAPSGTPRSIVGSCTLDGSTDAPYCDFYAPAGASGLGNPYSLAPVSGSYEATVEYIPDNSSGNLWTRVEATKDFSITKYTPAIALSKPHNADGTEYTSMDTGDNIFVTATLKVKNTDAEVPGGAGNISRSQNPVFDASTTPGQMFGGGLCIALDNAAANSGCKPIVLEYKATGAGINAGYDLWTYRVQLGRLVGGTHSVHAKYYGDVLYNGSPSAGDGVTFPGGPSISVERKEPDYRVTGNGGITSVTTGRDLVIFIGDVMPQVNRPPLGNVQLELRAAPAGTLVDDTAVGATRCNFGSGFDVIEDTNTSDGTGIITCRLPQLAEGLYILRAKFTADASENVLASNTDFVDISTFRVSDIVSKIYLEEGSSHDSLVMNSTPPGLANATFTVDGPGPTAGEVRLTSLNGSTMPVVGKPASTTQIVGTVTAWNCANNGVMCTGDSEADEDRVGPGGGISAVNPFKGRIKVELVDEDSSSSSSSWHESVNQADGHFTISLPKINVAGDYQIFVKYENDPWIGDGELGLGSLLKKYFHVNVAPLSAGDWGALLYPGLAEQSLRCDYQGFEDPGASGIWPDLTYNKAYMSANAVNTCNAQKAAYSVRFNAEHLPEDVSLADSTLSLYIKEYNNPDPMNAANTLLGDSNDESAQYGTHPLSEILSDLKTKRLTHRVNTLGHFYPGNLEFADNHWSYEYVINSQLPAGEYWLCGRIEASANTVALDTNCFKLVVTKNKLGPEEGSVCDPDSPDYSVVYCGDMPGGGKITFTNSNSLKNYFTHSLKGDEPTQVEMRVNFTGNEESVQGLITDGHIDWQVRTAAGGGGDVVASGTFTKKADMRHFTTSLPQIAASGNYFLYMELVDDSYVDDDIFDVPFTVLKTDTYIDFASCSALDVAFCAGSVISSQNGSNEPQVLLASSPSYPSGGQIVPIIFGSDGFKMNANSDCTERDYNTDPAHVRFSCFAPHPTTSGEITVGFYNSSGVLAQGLDGNTLTGASFIEAYNSTGGRFTFAMENNELTYGNALVIDDVNDSDLYHGQVLLGAKLPAFEVPGVYAMRVCYSGDAGLLSTSAGTLGCGERTFTIRPDKERPNIKVTSSMHTWASDDAPSPSLASGECELTDVDLAVDGLDLTDPTADCLPPGYRTDQAYVSSSDGSGDRIRLTFDLTSPIDDDTNVPSGTIRVNIADESYTGAEPAGVCLSYQRLASAHVCYVDAIVNTAGRASITLPKFARFGSYDVSFQYTADTGSAFSDATGSLSANNEHIKYEVQKARVIGDAIAVKANFGKVVEAGHDLDVQVAFNTHKRLAELFGCMDAQPDANDEHADLLLHIACTELTLTGTGLDPLSGSSGTATHTYHANAHTTSTIIEGQASVDAAGVQRYLAHFTIPAADLDGIENIGTWKIDAKVLGSDALFEADTLRYFAFDDAIACDNAAPAEADCDSGEDTTFETEMHSTVNFAAASVSGIDGAYRGSIVKSEGGLDVPSTGITSTPSNEDVTKAMGVHGYNIDCWVDITSQVVGSNGGINNHALTEALNSPATQNCNDDAVDFASYDIRLRNHVFMTIYHTYPGYCAKEFDVVNATDQEDCEDNGGIWYEKDQDTSGSQLLLHFWAPLDEEINPHLIKSKTTGETLGLAAGYEHTGFVIGDGWLCKQTHVGVHAQCSDTDDATHAETSLSTNKDVPVTSILIMGEDPLVRAAGLGGVALVRAAGAAQIGGTSATNALASQAFAPTPALPQGLEVHGLSTFRPQAADPQGNLDVECDDTHEAWAAGQANTTPGENCNVAQKADANETGRFKGEVVLDSVISAGSHVLVAQGVGEPYTSGVATYRLLSEAPVNPCPSNPSIERTDPACPSGGGENGSDGSGGTGNNPYCEGAQATNQADCEAAGGKWITGRCIGASADNEADCLNAGGRWVAFTGVSGAWLLLALLIIALAVALMFRRRMRRSN